MFRTNTESMAMDTIKKKLTDNELNPDYDIQIILLYNKMTVPCLSHYKCIDFFAIIQ